MKSTIFSTKNLQRGILSVCMLLLGSACTTEDLISDSPQWIQKINLSAGYPMLSRVNESGFADEDKMGVYVVDYDGDQQGELKSEGNHATNVKFQFDEKENRWNGSTDLYWKDKKTAIDIYGYYPYQTEINDVNQLIHLIGTQQNLPSEKGRLGDYEKSDFLWAKALKLTPREEAVVLTFQHIMAGITVTLQKGNGFTEEEWKELSKTVLVSNVQLESKIDLSTGDVKVREGEPKSVAPYEAGNDYRAVVAPQTVAAGTELLSITVGGETYSHKKEQAMNYQSGQMHRFTIQVNKREAQGDYSFKLINDEIIPWMDDSNFHDGIIREYITIQLDEKGTLEKYILDHKMDPQTIRGLKIQGVLNYYDFYYMGHTLSALENLNLKDVTIYDYNNELTNAIPENAFAEHPSLSHIVFPDKLTSIEYSAFRETGLIGTLIFPEKLRKIKGQAFSECKSLRGDLVFPNKVEYLGYRCFMNTGYTGNLSLSYNLKEIQDEAFANTSFKGKLVLPDGLEYIGYGAFLGHNFSGDLIIPKGIKKIYSGTFSCASYYVNKPKFRGFDGNLELPEGLKIIEGEAFAHNRFRGELKLPNSLKTLGSHVFENNEFSFVILGNQLHYIGVEAFKNNVNLSGMVQLPEGLHRVEKGLFYNCPLLEEVYLSNSIVEIADEAFFGCTGLSTLVCEPANPPKVKENTFYGVPRDQVTIEIPKASLLKYKQNPFWNEFGRMSTNRHFVCRPDRVSALNKMTEKDVVLYANGDWELERVPAWCSVSQKSGSQKTPLKLMMKELASGSECRVDTLVFRMKETGDLTYCAVSQYAYKYAENQCVQLQKAVKGKGIDIVFLAEGFDAKALADGKFLKDAQEKMEYLFDSHPYHEYRDYFNVYACMALSQETGIQTLNIYRDICFDTKFGGCYASLTTNRQLVLDYVKKYTPIKQPEHSMIVLIVNTSEYKGTTCDYKDSDNTFAICPINTNEFYDRMCMLKEAGGRHFAQLGDESYFVPNFPSDNVLKNFKQKHLKGWYQNLCLSGKYEDVPWKEFILAPGYSYNVDIFEGGYGYARAFFRSSYASCLNDMSLNYNIASRIEIVKRILNYSGEGFTMEKFKENDRN